MVGAIRQGFIKGIWIFMLPSGPRKGPRVRKKVREKVRGAAKRSAGLRKGPRGPWGPREDLKGSIGPHCPLESLHGLLSLWPKS